MGAGPTGKIRNPWIVILFTIITLGIYGLYWQYMVFSEMKANSGTGVGGPIGLLLAIIIGIVNWFLIPAELGAIYAGEGREKPVSGLTGFWNFIPIVGFFIWVIKVQGKMNELWLSHGATA